MVKVNDKTSKYITWAASGFLVLGYVLSFGSYFLLQDISVFPGNWFVKGTVIYLTIAHAIMASLEKERLRSIIFGIFSATGLIGVFFQGPQFLGILGAIFWLLYFMYKSFESFKRFLADAVKSYRQLRCDTEKQ